MKIEATVMPSPIGAPVADVAHVARPIGGQPILGAVLFLFLIYMRRVEGKTPHLLRSRAPKNSHPWIGKGRSLFRGECNNRNRYNKSTRKGRR